jgi:peptidoglycan/LPS O-acetylase OafA/YrhL
MQRTSRFLKSLIAFLALILYNHHNMPLSAETMRYLLAAFLIGMALLALLFLRRRELTTVQIIGWGLLIVLVPLLGPFLVIAIKPGVERHPARRLAARRYPFLGRRL